MMAFKVSSGLVRQLVDLFAAHSGVNFSSFSLVAAMPNTQNNLSYPKLLIFSIVRAASYANFSRCEWMTHTFCTESSVPTPVWRTN